MKHFGIVDILFVSVHKNQTIVEIFCDFQNKDIIIKSLKTAAYKIGSKNRIVVLRMKKPEEHSTKIGLAIADFEAFSGKKLCASSRNNTNGGILFCLRK